MGQAGGESAEPDAAEASADRAGVLTWLFVDGNRLLVTAVFVGATYVIVLGASMVVGPLQREETSPLFYLFSALAAGNFTLVTIVISISQLVISRQLGTPGEIRERIEATNDFRETIEETSEVAVAPVTPTEFLHLLLESAADRTETIRREAEGQTGEAYEKLEDATDRLAAHVDRVESKIADADVSIITALAVTLETNYSGDIYELRSLRTSYGDSYSESILDCLDMLAVRLQQIDVARQYLKNLYMQDELSQLSRNLLYVGIPAVFAAVFMLRGFAVGFETIGPDTLFAFVPLGVTVALAPLLMLFAYVLRLTTVARRTIAITPFTMAMQERERAVAEAD